MEQPHTSHRPKIRVAGRHFHLPGSALGRKMLGGALVLGGVLGFLPILGFWMIPLGLVVLSIDIPAIRRGRRRLTVWWERRKQARKSGKKPDQ